jgi:glycosyltransferase involved in cell wall biosynthesis
MAGAQTESRNWPLALDEVWAGPYPELPHVLLVVDQFPRALGGGEKTVLRLAELLPSYGFRASVLTFAMHPESSVPAAALPFPLYLLPLERTYDLTAMRAARALGRFLREQSVVLVQTFFESSDLWAGLVIKTLSSARLVWSRRDMGILRSAKHRLAYRLLSNMPDEIFAVSEGVRRHCIEVDGIDPPRVCTIYNGLDVNKYLPRRQTAPGRLTVTTVGNIRHVKGHDVLIQAAALVLAQCPGVSFSIAGEILEPGYFAELQRLVTELGIDESFHFDGGVRNVSQHLAGADIFVLPSRSEGFSNSILEAMACSLPVIATDVGGNPEAVLNEVTGYIVPPENPAALARCILHLSGDRALCRSLGAAGRARAEERFSTEAMMQQVTLAYRRLLGVEGGHSS